ncbi:MAG: dipeptidyl-peptidase 4 [Planctomycetota bacterium]|nr:MAG: dipeptidyl-peptidase 4 [Planctomycetota bacterium]
MHSLLTLTYRFLLVAVVLAFAGASSANADDAAVTTPPTELKVDPFHKKYLSAGGYPIVASESVNDFALKEAAYLVNLMLAKRPDVKEAMIKSGSRLCIIAHNEFTTDVPEFAWLKPKDYWDARARGTGGSKTDAHNIHLRGMVNVDPTFDRRLKETYDRAMTAGLWKGKYAATNHHEYFAEGVQSWFDNNRENDHDHNHVNTREELHEYDPGLAAMCREVFGDTKLVYTKPATRLKDHLTGYDPSTAPKFVWPERLNDARREIREKAVARSKQASGEPMSVSPRTDSPPGSAADATRLANEKQDDKQPNPLLTVDRLFASNEFDEEGLGTFVWKKHGTGYFTFDKPKAEGAGRDLIWRDSATDESKVVVSDEAFIPADAEKDAKGNRRPISVESFQFSDDELKLLIFTNSRRVWRRNTRGDYWVLDIAKHELKKLGGDAKPSTLMFAKFSPDASRVAFVRDNNLFVQNLADLSIAALTKDGSATLINGTSDWVYEEELDLRDGFRWSPDSKSIAFWQLDASGVREFFLINNTDESYSKPIGIRYPKVGEQNSSARIGVVSASGGEPKWLDVPGDSRNHYLAQLEWTPDGKHVALQQFNRLQNTNRVMLGDPLNGTTRTILTETDPAWLENENPFRWVKNGEQFVWISERDASGSGSDGDRSGPLPDGRGTEVVRRLAPGDQFDMIGFEAIDEATGSIYFSASPDNATQRSLYRASLDGEKSERLTPDNQPGWHTYNISPDGKFAVHTYSAFMRRPTMELVSLPDHKHLRLLVSNGKLCVKLASLKRPAVEFSRLDIGNGVELDAWCLKPPGFDPNAEKKYPLLIHVYGEPHGQTVRDAWTGKRGMWHWLLAQQGYVVASVDNRGTMSPRGREFRKVVYRQVGILHPAEQAAAAKEMLKRWPQVDPARVGIWGWSGGGSSTLHAMFQFPDLYRTGISVAPVPNQKLYDTIYQERYMGLPSDNAEGFTKGSPITHAKNLKGNLLIVHGTGDDNCHYQGVEMLMNELITHNKKFSMMAYPNRSHAISEGANTTRHLYELMTEYLHQHLPTQ